MILKLDRLELPAGGWVEFNDPEMVRGVDIDRLREEAQQQTRVIGKALNTMLRVGAELLIAKWDIPYLPGAPVPSEKPQFWGELRRREKLAIEGHMVTVVSIMAGFMPEPADEQDAVSPPPPASE